MKLSEQLYDVLRQIANIPDVGHPGLFEKAGELVKKVDDLEQGKAQS